MADNEIPSLTEKEFVIMNLLIGSVKEMYGLQLVDKSEGLLKKGTIYVTLKRLEDKGYVQSRKEEEQPGVAMPRRLYKATGLGARVFRAIERTGGGDWLKAYAL